MTPSRDMARLATVEVGALSDVGMVSTDSHVMEPDELWQQLPDQLYRELPKIRFGETPAGGTNPIARLEDQKTDGVAAEILFPNYGMALFGVDNVELQQEGFQALQRLAGGVLPDRSVAIDRRAVHFAVRRGGRNRRAAARAELGAEGSDDLAGPRSEMAVHQ